MSSLMCTYLFLMFCAESTTTVTHLCYKNCLSTEMKGWNQFSIIQEHLWVRALRPSLAEMFAHTISPGGIGCIAFGLKTRCYRDYHQLQTLKNSGKTVMGVRSASSLPGIAFPGEYRATASPWAMQTLLPLLVRALFLVAGANFAIGLTDVPQSKKKCVLKTFGVACLAIAGGGGLAFALLSVPVSVPIAAIAIVGGCTAACFGGIAIAPCLQK
uniref:Uncharacterized protein n=1 Tax=Ditylenchus dipsaci TaxID=166011 RepID=A0A915E7Z8_9BILA